MATSYNARCCIAGGGPAGMMLGLLLARASVDTVVLEKHADFFRDFRGDTVHPSTLEVMHELGLLEAFLSRPHDKARKLTVTVGGQELTIADFSHVRTRCKFIAMMLQWEFMDLLRDEAANYLNFGLLMNAEVTGLIDGDAQVRGISCSTPDGPMHITADLVIGADGRRSTVRTAAGLEVKTLGAPIDVLWMRVPMGSSDPLESGGRIGNGQFLAMIHRGSYWQCAYIIPKGGIDRIRARGLEAFREQLIAIAPFFADRVSTLTSWDDIKLLSVSVDRLERWLKPGLLCIGDAAHAMSPIGGIGINLAIQDAVATANFLAVPLARKEVRQDELASLLAKVQQRRLLPTRVTQAAQVALQNRFLAPLVSGRKGNATRVPTALRLLNRFPLLRAVPAYAVGIGVRPEHVGR